MIVEVLMVTLDLRRTANSASHVHVFRRVSCCSLSCEKCDIEDDALSVENHLAPSSTAHVSGVKKPRVCGGATAWLLPCMDTHDVALSAKTARRCSLQIAGQPTFLHLFPIFHTPTHPQPKFFPDHHIPIEN